MGEIIIAKLLPFTSTMVDHGRTSSRGRTVKYTNVPISKGSRGQKEGYYQGGIVRFSECRLTQYTLLWAEFQHRDGEPR